MDMTIEAPKVHANVALAPLESPSTTGMPPSRSASTQGSSRSHATNAHVQSDERGFLRRRFIRILPGYLWNGSSSSSTGSRSKTEPSAMIVPPEPAEPPPPIAASVHLLLVNSIAAAVNTDNITAAAKKIDLPVEREVQPSFGGIASVVSEAWSNRNIDTLDAIDCTQTGLPSALPPDDAATKASSLSDVYTFHSEKIVSYSEDFSVRVHLWHEASTQPEQNTTTIPITTPVNSATQAKVLEFAAAPVPSPPLLDCVILCLPSSDEIHKMNAFDSTANGTPTETQTTEWINEQTQLCRQRLISSSNSSIVVVLQISTTPDEASHRPHPEYPPLDLGEAPLAWYRCSISPSHSDQDTWPLDKIFQSVVESALLRQSNGDEYNRKDIIDEVQTIKSNAPPMEEGTGASSIALLDSAISTSSAVSPSPRPDGNVTANRKRRAETTPMPIVCHDNGSPDGNGSTETTSLATLQSSSSIPTTLLDQTSNRMNTRTMSTVPKKMKVSGTAHITPANDRRSIQEAPVSTTAGLQ